MDHIGTVFSQTLQSSCQPLKHEWSREEMIAHEVDRSRILNAVRIDPKTGDLDCRRCGNKRYIPHVDDQGRHSVSRCPVCTAVLELQSAMRKSGIPGWKYEEFRFNKWVQQYEWQKVALETAREYVRRLTTEPDFWGWFVAAGRSGAGKTMLCSAVIFEAVTAGLRGVRYHKWRDLTGDVKSQRMDIEARKRFRDEILRPKLLYIDDFLKGSKPTSADLDLAYEIVDTRYENRLPLVLSSEHDVEKLIRAQEAVGGRIWEMCKGFYIDATNARDWRTAQH